MAAADFTGDGYPDLALGSPGEDYEESANGDYGPVGVVHVLPGGPGGLATSRDTVLRGIRTTGRSGFDVGFGSRLATGDLDRDGVADLVVGSEGARFIDDGYPGSVSVCLGARGGPSGCSRLVHEEELANVSTLAVANISGSATPEVLAGAGLSEEDDEGKVAVLQLKDSDPRRLAKQTLLTPESPGIPHGTGYEEGFGTSIAVGDIDRDGYSDLVIGTTSTSTGYQRGRVTVVHGGVDGYRTTGDRTYDQASRGVPGKSEDGDRFGDAVTLLDHDADGHLDLSVGADGEDDHEGAVTTLPGSGTGFTTRGSRSIKLSSLGYAHPRDASFGDVLGR